MSFVIRSLDSTVQNIATSLDQEEGKKASIILE